MHCRLFSSTTKKRRKQGGVSSQWETLFRSIIVSRDKYFNIRERKREREGMEKEEVKFFRLGEGSELSGSVELG